MCRPGEWLFVQHKHCSGDAHVVLPLSPCLCFVPFTGERDAVATGNASFPCLAGGLDPCPGARPARPSQSARPGRNIQNIRFVQTFAFVLETPRFAARGKGKGAALKAVVTS